MKITLIILGAIMLVIGIKAMEENNDSVGENYAEQEEAYMDEVQKKDAEEETLMETYVEENM